MEVAKCPYCGSADIAQGIRVGQTAECGSIGLSYTAVLLLTGTEPLLADLCGDCGSVIRLCVANPEFCVFVGVFPR